jgi:hypothetical protein
MHRNNAVIPGEGGDTNRSGKARRATSFPL